MTLAAGVAAVTLLVLVGRTFQKRGDATLNTRELSGVDDGVTPAIGLRADIGQGLLPPARRPAIDVRTHQPHITASTGSGR